VNRLEARMGEERRRRHRSSEVSVRRLSDGLFGDGAVGSLQEVAFTRGPCLIQHVAPSSRGVGRRLALPDECLASLAQRPD